MQKHLEIMGKALVQLVFHCFGSFTFTSFSFTSGIIIVKFCSCLFIPVLYATLKLCILFVVGFFSSVIVTC